MRTRLAARATRTKLTTVMTRYAFCVGKLQAMGHVQPSVEKRLVGGTCGPRDQFLWETRGKACVDRATQPRPEAGKKSLRGKEMRCKCLFASTTLCAHALFLTCVWLQTGQNLSQSKQPRTGKSPCPATPENGADLMSMIVPEFDKGAQKFAAGLRKVSLKVPPDPT